MRVEIETKGLYIEARCAGEYDLPQLKEVYRRAMREAVERGVPKILVDARQMRGEMPALDRYRLSTWGAERYREILPTMALQIATVASEEMIGEKLGETTARNRGVWAKSTTSLERALEWLEVNGPEAEGSPKEGCE